MYLFLFCKLKFQISLKMCDSLPSSSAELTDQGAERAELAWSQSQPSNAKIFTQAGAKLMEEEK